MNSINLGIAFVAGLVSFLAPCVLPLIPGFFAYLAGTPLAETGSHRLRVFINSVFFVLGFSTVFAVLGVILNAVLEGAAAYDLQIWASRIGGLLVIFFGLYLTGLIKIGFLEKEHKFAVKTKFSSRYFTSFLFGAAFAAGWTPCVGAVLGAILGLAASSPGTAFTLLLAYSFGLGLPFLIVGLFAAEAQKLIAKLGRSLTVINAVFGILLIGLGILIFTQNLSRIANFELLNRLLLN